LRGFPAVVVKCPCAILLRLIDSSSCARARLFVALFGTVVHPLFMRKEQKNKRTESTLLRNVLVE
jgi:hypothetical protein